MIRQPIVKNPTHTLTRFWELADGQLARMAPAAEVYNSPTGTAGRSQSRDYSAPVTDADYARKPTSAARDARRPGIDRNLGV
jgi:hypothetical protein